MRIVVTGSTGRLGRRTVQTLREGGHEVLPVDVRVPEDGSAPDTRVVNLTVYEGLTTLFAGCDVIVHLGNLPGFGHSGRAEGYRNNTVSNNNVFQAADELKINRIIYASSVQSYGCFGGSSGHGSTFSAPRYLPLDEDHPLLPADAYPLSKATGEWIAEAFVRRRPELTAWSLRFTGIRAPRDPSRPPRVVKEGSPDAWFRGSLNTFIYVDDAARAVLLCCQTERPGHTPLNIVAPKAYRPWSPELLRSAYGCLPEFRRELGPEDSLISGERAAALIGFTPQYTLADLPA
jgi:nucleoside-diphosphate-sugar epimerase